VVVEYLGAGAAGAGGAHHPEVVVGRDADDAVVREPCDLLPDQGGLVVGVVDRHQEAAAVDAEVPSQKLPGEGDRLLLEVVAEGEVAEHLEEGVVPRRVAHIVEVVVLAARAHAFLRRRGARIGPASSPVKTFLNWTMPEFVNISVGSLRGTSGEDATASCPLRTKKSRKVERMSARLVMAGS
jgi:hypothetical protein